jgi:hypothetical protein
MSDEPGVRTGQVGATPEGGPIGEGVPGPGTGQVRFTPEAGPPTASEAGERLVPPTLRDHLQGPILGLDDVAAAAAAAPGASQSGEGAQVADEASRETNAFGPTRAAQDDAELRKWPPFTGKPVSEVRWDALRYAAPLVSQAEKLTIRAIDLSGRGLSRLARYLETRREERRAASEGAADEER